MPSFTFRNLEDRRQEEIIAISLNEFASHDYESASVSRIVKEVGVAKGSFYRYFRNKLDLYSYLVEYTTKLQQDKMEKIFEEADSFFELLVQNYYMRIKFDIDFPLEGKFLYNMMRERNSAELGNMLLKTKQRMMEMMYSWVEKFQINGELKNDIDIEWIAFQVIHQQYGIYDYLSLKLQRKSKEEKRPLSFSDLDTKEIERAIRGFVEMMELGMGTKSQRIPEYLPEIRIRKTIHS